MDGQPQHFNQIEQRPLVVEGIQIGHASLLHNPPDVGKNGGIRVGISDVEGIIRWKKQDGDNTEDDKTSR